MTSYRLLIDAKQALNGPIPRQPIPVISVDQNESHIGTEQNATSEQKIDTLFPDFDKLDQYKQCKYAYFDYIRAEYKREYESYFKVGA